MALSDIARRLGSTVSGGNASSGNSGGALNQNAYGYSNSGGPAGQNQSGYGDASGGYGGGYGGGWYGVSGGGSGGGSSGPSDTDKDAFDTLKSIFGYQINDVLPSQWENSMKAYDVGEQGIKNSQNFQLDLAKQNSTAEWFSNLLKLQSTAKNIWDRGGNAWNGSAANQYITDIMRSSDATASSIIEALENNMGQIDTEAYEALQNIVNGKNELAVDIDTKTKQGYADFVSQANSLNPGFVTGEGTGYEDYDSLIDKDNHTLKNPYDWLNLDWYDEHQTEAIQPELREHLRPAAATQQADQKNLYKSLQNFSQAANSSYWDSRFNSGNRGR